jgi:hypothetical protein
LPSLATHRFHEQQRAGRGSIDVTDQPNSTQSWQSVEAAVDELFAGDLESLFA